MGFFGSSRGAAEREVPKAPVLTSPSGRGWDLNSTPPRTSRSAVRSSTGKMRARDSRPRGLPGDRKVAVLGGSFDPITDGHLKCACEIVHARAADEVWIVPCGARPDKPSLRTPYMHRLIMCHLAVDTSFGSHFPIRVCDIEMGEPQALSTYMLLQRLNADHPGTKFMFVLGADLLESIKTWGAPGVENAGEKLYREGNFLLLARPGYDIPLDLPANFKLLTPQAGTRIVTEDVSSSEIRKRIAANFGETERAEMQQGNFAMVDGLLTPAVLAHIIRYDIYGL